MNEESLFNKALEKPFAERSVFLDEACAGQPELRAAVEALLAAYEATGNILDQPVDAGQPELGAAVEALLASDETPGTVPDQPVEKLGEPVDSDSTRGEHAPDSLPEILAAANQSGGVVIAVTEGPHRGKVFQFRDHDTFLVGRSKRAHFRLPAKDEFFSRLHFLVELNPPHCQLMDMGSTNGTFVNGEKVALVELKDGDVIQGGQTVMKVTFEDPEDEEDVTRSFQDNQIPAGGTPQMGEKEPDHLVPVQLTSELSVVPVLPGYELLRPLGKGGMGEVHLARRISDGRIVAVKTILPAVRGSATQVKRFLREAEILCQLDHPNIVKFLEMGESRGLLYFVMDYINGWDASKLVQQEGLLSVSRTASLGCQLLDALQFAHERNFVHRDIKPGNIMVTLEAHDELKVVDFGLARVYQASKLSGLTITGQIIGTPKFMAPEQILQFREVNPSVDQFAAGATLYFLLTGQLIYDFPSSQRNCLLMILQEAPVPIRSRRPDIPEELAAVIHRSLAKEPADRFPDVQTMREALQAFV